MESILTLSDAKARFSEIVEKAVKGEEFVVTRMGKPVFGSSVSKRAVGRAGSATSPDGYG